MIKTKIWFSTYWEMQQNSVWVSRCLPHHVQWETHCFYNSHSLIDKNTIAFLFSCRVQTSISNTDLCSFRCLANCTTTLSWRLKPCLLTRTALQGSIPSRVEKAHIVSIIRISRINDYLKYNIAICWTSLERLKITQISYVSWF